MLRVIVSFTLHSLVCSSSSSSSSLAFACVWTSWSSSRSLTRRWPLSVWRPDVCGRRLEVKPSSLLICLDLKAVAHLLNEVHVWATEYPKSCAQPFMEFCSGMWGCKWILMWLTLTCCLCRAAELPGASLHPATGAQGGKLHERCKCFIWRLCISTYLLVWIQTEVSCALRVVMLGMLQDSGFPLYSNWPTPKPTNQAWTSSILSPW